MADQDLYPHCLSLNKSWAQTTTTQTPTLLPTLSKGQHPPILWLGCSDSRVPETTILGLQPGDVFVHRNIANILPATDLSSLSVIFYALQHLKVQHVVLCGHTSCGGAAAALGNARLGVVDAWLAPLRALRMQHAKDWDGLGPEEKCSRLVEANVRKGVQTLRENPDVIQGMRERGVQVHGLVYELGTGLLREVQCAEEEEGARMQAFELGAGGHEEKPAAGAGAGAGAGHGEEKKEEVVGGQGQEKSGGQQGGLHGIGIGRLHPKVMGV